jgi:hypothetical protein
VDKSVIQSDNTANLLLNRLDTKIGVQSAQPTLPHQESCYASDKSIPRRAAVVRMAYTASYISQY